MASFHCEVGSVKRVAVIGAGVSGLAAIKSCLEEGLEPVCFEARSCIGGLWAAHKANYKKEAFIYNQLVFNTSKEMSCFSDFPYPKSYPPYLSREQQFEYLKSYADHFGLLDHIRFNTTVVSVTPTSKTSESGPQGANQKWGIRASNKLAPDEEPVEEVFDAVMICSGSLVVAEQPEYPGQDEFLGRTIHSCQYRQGADYEDENVLIVGSRNSAGDIAVECSRYAQNVYISSRKGIIVFPRMVNGGVPVDAYGNTLLGSYLPLIIRKKVVDQLLSQLYDLKDFGLLPDSRIPARLTSMVNDEIVQRIAYGRVKPKPSIKAFKLDRVVFSDNSNEKIDTVIYATGYRAQFPFIDDSILEDDVKKRSLYLHTFPTAIKRPTLAVIGQFFVMGATAPVFEMQTRCAVSVFKGLTRLPDRPAMQRSIEERRAINMYQYGMDKPFVEFVQTISEFAKLIGCYPRLWQYLRNGDFQLFWSILAKPFFPYVTRLEGQHCWPGARQAIFEGMDNMYSATRSPPLPVTVKTRVNWRAVLVLALVILLVLVQFQVISFR